MAVLFGAFPFCLLLNLVAASQPELSFTVTRDVTFMCTTGGFQGTFDRLVDLQIVKLDDSQTKSDMVLATVTNANFWASDYLKNVHPLHTVSGQLYSRHHRSQSWLRLTVYDVGSLGHGAYVCQVAYMDHAADPQHLVWKAVLDITEPDLEKKEIPGFMAKAIMGVHVECSDDTISDPGDHISSIVILSEDTECNLSWCETDNQTKSTSDFVGTYYEPKTSVLHAHMPDVTCAKQSDYVCIVKKVTGETKKSVQKRLPFDNCQVNSDLTTSSVKADSTDRSTNSHSTSSINLSLIGGLIVGVILLIVIVISIFFCRRSSRTKNLGHYFQNLRESFNQQTKQGMTKIGSCNKEDIENLRNEAMETTSKEKNPKGIMQKNLVPFLSQTISDCSSCPSSSECDSSEHLLTSQKVKEKGCIVSEDDYSALHKLCRLDSVLEIPTTRIPVQVTENVCQAVMVM